MTPRWRTVFSPRRAAPERLPGNLTLPRVNRRTFLQSAAATAVVLNTGCVATHSPTADIIDTHTHFYDPTRSGGVPWPDPQDAVLYKPFLPSQFIPLVEPLGVTGTVVVEASAWIQDNDWLLRLADEHPFVLGVVGHLNPGEPEFRSQLSRLANNRLFRGIRIGPEILTNALQAGAAQDDLRRLADLHLSLDLLIPPERLPDAARLGSALPTLRIIVDHCANVPVGSPPPGEWTGGLAACHYTPNVSMKVSGLVEGTGRRGGTASTDPVHYRTVLDSLWHPFGEDRLIYGSNWPVCLHFATYATVLRIVQDYFTAKGPRAAAHYFHQNAIRTYALRRR